VERGRETVAILYEGFLRELVHEASMPIEYGLWSEKTRVSLNEVLGLPIKISFTGAKACIACGRKVKKLFQSGYCFPCVTSLAECDLCIVKPHECHYHLGTCRDESFAHSHCMIPHYVYLAFSSGVKVGLTRKGRQVRRWVDQGATSAILVAEVPTRKDAGELEMAIAEHLPDKTDWRKMIRTETTDENTDLQAIKKDVLAKIDPKFHSYVVSDDTVYHFQYPRMPDFIPKLSSVSLDKQPTIESRLVGIKGQYLLFEDCVFQVKKHSGYYVQISV
jgi:hypothetical protein